MSIAENISLKAFNTFGIDVQARWYATTNSLAELQAFIEWKKTQEQPLLVLGGGSNILFTKNFDGLVLRNTMKGFSLVKEEEDFYYVKAMAGENWHEFVNYCIKNNYAGVENLSLIPGNVGASPMQNIGAYGVEIKDVFYALEAYHIEDEKTVTFYNSDCEFGYRESIFKKQYKNQFIILSVTYRLPKQPIYNTSYGAIEKELEKQQVKELSIGAISKAVINIRQSKLPDPQKIGNAGSFFKNPVIPTEQYIELQKKINHIPGYSDSAITKVPAGWLIEYCGWKGFRLKDAGCYPLQALVLVNYGKAKGSEIFQLSEQIIKTVQDKFGITLEREVNVY